VPLTGTIDGDTVKFGINVNVQGQSLQIDYSGTVTGDTIERHGRIRLVRRRQVDRQEKA
jgi:hypothetical protein